MALALLGIQFCFCLLSTHAVYVPFFRDQCQACLVKGENSLKFANASPKQLRLVSQSLRAQKMILSVMILKICGLWRLELHDQLSTFWRIAPVQSSSPSGLRCTLNRVDPII